MKELKKIMAMIACVVLLWGQTVRAVAIPLFEYIPPADVQIFGWLNNLYGMTAISEGTEEEKLETYWNMYRAIMGSAYDSFRSDMQEVLNNAKTSRHIYISPTLNQTIVDALKYAKNNGVVIGQSLPPATTPQQWVDELYKHGINMTLAMATDLKSRIEQNGYVGNGQPYTLGVGVDDSGEIRFWPYYVGLNTYFAPHPIAPGYIKFYYGEGQDRFYQYIYYMKLNTMKVNGFKSWALTGASVKPYNNIYFKMSGNETKVYVSAMSNNAEVSIENEEQIPITANSEIIDGEVDRTKSIIINLPAINPYPAVDPQQIAEVLRELGVVPQSETEDVAETVTELQEQASVKYGDTGDYAVDLTTYFPFCIPFDLVRIVSALDAESEAPHFTFPLPSDIQDGEVVFTEYEFSLDWLSPAMVWVRRGELVLGAIGIMLMTRNIIRG